MKFLGHHATDSSQWAAYQQLELIPSMPNPSSRVSPLASGLNLLWHPLLALLIDELVEEQRVEYLDRCWLLNTFGEGNSNSLQRLWTLMN